MESKPLTAAERDYLAIAPTVLVEYIDTLREERDALAAQLAKRDDDVALLNACINAVKAKLADADKRGWSASADAQRLLEELAEARGIAWQLVEVLESPYQDERRAAKAAFDALHWPDPKKEN